MITTELWQVYMPGEPPEGCTYRMFAAAREATWREQDLEYNIKRVQELRVMWKNASPEFRKLIEIEARVIKDELSG